MWIRPGGDDSRPAPTGSNGIRTTGPRLPYARPADGRKICGAEAAILGCDDAAPFDLAMESGYTSRGNTGSTVTSGSETIQAKLFKEDCKELGVAPSGRRLGHSEDLRGHGLRQEEEVPPWFIHGVRSEPSR